MKKPAILIRMTLACVLLVPVARRCPAQFLKNLKAQVSETVQQTVQQRTAEKAGTATNSAIDKTSSAVGSEAAKILKGKPASGDPAKETSSTTDNAANTETLEANPRPETAVPDADTAVASMPATHPDYANYDFVPGDRILFQPDLSGEADAELPARFTIKHGNAEIQSSGGEKVLRLQAGGSSTVTPLMDTSSYLPDQFTLEFDMLLENEGSYFAYASDFVVAFRKPGDQGYYGGSLYALDLSGTSRCSFGNTGTLAFPEALARSFGTGNTWHHVAIYVHHHVGKAYIDQYRVVATNTLTPGAATFDVQADRYAVQIKNLRLAGGGDDKYQKIVSDGKFVTHGILFDVNQSSIKPESTGALREIARLMGDHSDLRFEIDGYTDSDGSEDANLTLSEARAEAVKEKLVSMGIEDSRLRAKGLGETHPIDTNDTAEGKANNRRVEFVKW